MLKRTGRDEVKGISYIISVVLMLLIVSVVGAIIMNWGRVLMMAQQQAYGSVLEISNQRLMEGFMVENVYYDKALGRLTIYIRNYGLINITISTIYVNDKAYININQEISVGRVEGVTLDYPDVHRQTTILIAVISSRGNKYEGYYVIP